MPAEGVVPCPCQPLPNHSPPAAPLQLHARVAELSAAKAANATKLAELKGGGARLVSADDVQKAEKVMRVEQLRQACAQPLF